MVFGATFLLILLGSMRMSAINPVVALIRGAAYGEVAGLHEFARNIANKDKATSNKVIRASLGKMAVVDAG